MKTIKRKALYICLLLTLGFAACEKTEENKLSKEETEVIISDLGNDMSSDLVGIMDTEGGKALESLVSLFNSGSLFKNEEFGGRTQKELKVTAENFYNMFIPSKKISGRSFRTNEFIFEEYTGVYNYNFDIKDFERVADSDIVEINFPSKGSPILNAQLLVHGISMIEYHYVDESAGIDVTDPYPTFIDADIKVNGILQASIDLSMAYNEDFMPTNVTISALIKPYSFEIDYSETNSTNSTFNASISDGQTLIASVDVDVIKDTDGFIEGLDGFVQYKEIKIQGSYSLPAYTHEEVMIGTRNDYINLSIYQSGEKLGTIKFFETEGDFGAYDEPYLVYNDGSKKLLDEVLEPVIAKVEEEIENIFGTNDSN